MRRIASVVVVAGLAAALAACSQDKPSTPAANTGTPPPAAQANAGAPKVAAPMDLTKFTGAPCEVLQADQVTKILGQDNKPAPDPKGPAGPACTWNNSNATGSVSVVFPTVFGGLADVYKNRTGFAYFVEQPPIQGYPAVAAAMMDMRPDGRCRLVIGASDATAIEVHRQLTGDDPPDLEACKATYDVANTIITNMKAKK